MFWHFSFRVVCFGAVKQNACLNTYKNTRLHRHNCAEFNLLCFEAVFCFPLATMLCFAVLAKDVDFETLLPFCLNIYILSCYLFECPMSSVSQQFSIQSKRRMGPLGPARAGPGQGRAPPFFFLIVLIIVEKQRTWDIQNNKQLNT